MIDCKNCLHYEVCKSHYGDEVLRYINGDCSNFADNSKVIELPCKVGDIIYYNNPMFTTISTYFVKNFNIAFSGNKDEPLVYTFNAESFCEYEFSDSIYFKPKDIGKTVFLTYQEAKQALNEIKQ